MTSEYDGCDFAVVAESSYADALMHRLAMPAHKCRGIVISSFRLSACNDAWVWSLINGIFDGHQRNKSVVRCIGQLPWR